MKKKAATLVHIYLSTTTALLCILWIWINSSISIELIIFIQFCAIIISLFYDAGLRHKTERILSNADDDQLSDAGLKLYLKTNIIGTVIILAIFSLTLSFLDYENNPEIVVLTIKLVTVFTILLAHNWYVYKVHKTKL